MRAYCRGVKAQVGCSNDDWVHPAAAVGREESYREERVKTLEIDTGSPEYVKWNRESLQPS